MDCRRYKFAIVNSPETFALHALMTAAADVFTIITFESAVETTLKTNETWDETD